MGEGQSKPEPTGLFSTTNPLIQGYLAPKPQVTPYREGMPAPKESILQIFLKRNGLQSPNRSSFGFPSEQARRSPQIEAANIQLVNRPDPRTTSQGRFQETPSDPQLIKKESHFIEDYHPSYDQSMRKGQSQYFGADLSTSKANINEERDTRVLNTLRESPPERFQKEKEITTSRYKEQRTKSVEKQHEDGKWERNPGGRLRSRRGEEEPGFEYRFKGEERFTPTEIEILRENFENYSKENRINKFSLLKLLSLEDFEDSIIGSRIYSCIKQISSQGATFGNYINYERYIQAMGILCRGDVPERLEFIYNIFDPNGEGFVSIEEMKNVIDGLFRILRSTKFEHPTLNALNEKISEIDEDEIEVLLEEIVREIFVSYGKEPNYLSLEEWKSWFMTQYGMFDVLNYKIKRIDV